MCWVAGLRFDAVRLFAKSSYCNLLLGCQLVVFTCWEGGEVLAVAGVLLPLVELVQANSVALWLVKISWQTCVVPVVLVLSFGRHSRRYQGLVQWRPLLCAGLMEGRSSSSS